MFISNDCKTVPLRRQRSSTRSDGLVVWDYHVMILTQRAQRVQVLDLDTSLPFPCDALQYIAETCSEQIKRPQFQQRFRLVPARAFLRTFASDRSHMDRPDAPPPPMWSPIRGVDALTSMNLPLFWEMNDPSPAGISASVGQHKLFDLYQLVVFVRSLLAAA
jgi:hypothetical protein